jgi:uncharacterized membrane protein
MDQQTINEREWGSTANWSGPRWLSLYFSKADSRVWVRKQIPGLGWTINLGHRNGLKWFLSVLVATILIVVLSNIVMINLIVP